MFDDYPVLNEAVAGIHQKINSLIGFLSCLEMKTLLSFKHSVAPHTHQNFTDPTQTNQRRLHTTITVSQGGDGSVRRQVLTPAQRTKLNTEDDRAWYFQPRIVHHSDANFRRQVTRLYRERIPQGGTVLDLCSSWVSHLPDDVKYEKVVGHGLNAVELGKNPRLDQFFIRNLNNEPDDWALPSDSFDAVLICCSVQYFQQPERVFAEIYRVLKPGGAVIVTFTRNLFYAKAVAAWRDGTMYSRTQLVKQYCLAIDGFSDPEEIRAVGFPETTSPLETATRAVLQLFERSQGDPFYAVTSYKKQS